jgi:hypothetical protein
LKWRKNLLAKWSQNKRKIKLAAVLYQLPIPELLTRRELLQQLVGYAVHWHQLIPRRLVPSSAVADAGQDWPTGPGYTQGPLIRK